MNKNYQEYLNNVQKLLNYYKNTNNNKNEEIINYLAQEFTLLLVNINK